MNRLKENAEFSNYRVQRVIRLHLIDAVFFELHHLPTGARHIHIANSDTENTFSVLFKTVPTDSTGVAHILEHTVLCGSRRFPVRDPFFSMMKRSMSTFMNAFTASDWTMYPFSTQNRKDFYNLMDVYLDATFFPKLDPLSFKQEGHRIEIEPHQAGTDDFSLVYKGVVYNEMKGAMSSPDQVMVRSLLNALYPDVTYRHNSGGEPSVIPSLTHERLIAFHRRHYHPGNAVFYTYGNLPLTDHLEYLDRNLLSRFSSSSTDTHVPPQPRWNSPRTASRRYPLSDSEDLSRKAQSCIAWLTADITDAFNVLALTLMEQILLGNPSSPLRKALIESGLGSDLADGTGYSPDYRDTFFACGLKDIAASDAPAVEALVMDELRRLHRDGIDEKLIDAAIHQIEFGRKEVTNTPYPFGLKLLLQIAAAYIHGGDPLHILDFEKDLERIKAESVRGGFFEKLIDRYLLDNPHRVRLDLLPDPHLADEERRKEAASLEERRAGMTPEEIARIRKDAERLRRRQESEEDVSCLPTLTLADIPPTVPTVSRSDAFPRIPLVCYRQPTADIVYFTSAVKISGLDETLLPLLPLFCHALTKIGTQSGDYTDVTHRIDAYTGGIGLAPQARTHIGERVCLPFITLNGKCLSRNTHRLLDLLQELTEQFSFTDIGRLERLLMEYRTRLESSVIHNGHRLAMSLAARNFSRAGHLDEIWSGIHQLKTMKSLTEDLSETGLISLRDRLTGIGETLFQRDNFHTAVIGESAALEDIGAFLTDRSPLYVNRQPGFPAGWSFTEFSGTLPEIHEAWHTDTTVSFVAQAFQTVPMGHPDAPALAVISKLLRANFLHREIREKGGAYGGFAIYTPETGLFCMGSYRDPHIVSTLSAYDRAGEYAVSEEYGDEDVTEAVLQVCSDMDRPDPPGPAARKSFYREIVGLSDEMRREFKKQLLALNRDRIAQAAETYFADAAGKKSTAVISNEERIASANAALPEALEVHAI